MSSKKTDFGIILFSTLAAAEWWFLSLAPSRLAILIALLLLLYAIVGFCLMAILAPKPVEKPKAPSFVPLRQNDTHQLKELTHQW